MQRLKNDQTECKMHFDPDQSNPTGDPSPAE